MLLEGALFIQTLFLGITFYSMFLMCRKDYIQSGLTINTDYVAEDEDEDNYQSDNEDEDEDEVQAVDETDVNKENDEPIIEVQAVDEDNDGIFVHKQNYLIEVETNNLNDEVERIRKLLNEDSDSECECDVCKNVEERTKNIDQIIEQKRKITLARDVLTDTLTDKVGEFTEMAHQFLRQRKVKNPKYNEIIDSFFHRVNNVLDQVDKMD
jgi:hypothetical protein